MPYKIHRVFEKPADAAWNTDSYTEEDRQIAADYVQNLVNVQPGYKGEVEKIFIDENTMKLSYTLYSEADARKFVKSISNIGNPYFKRFHNIERNTTQYRIKTYIEDENGNTEPYGIVINPNLTQI
jgi:hypothetical protein